MTVGTGQALAPPRHPGERVDLERDEGITGDEHAVSGPEERDVTGRVTGRMEPSPSRQVRDLTIGPKWLDDSGQTVAFEHGVAAAATEGRSRSR